MDNPESEQVCVESLKQGEKMQDRVHKQLQKTGNNPKLVRSFLKHPPVTYIFKSDCAVILDSAEGYSRPKSLTELATNKDDSMCTISRVTC